MSIVVICLPCLWYKLRQLLHSCFQQGFYGDDDDSEPSMYFNNQSLFQPHRPEKDSMTSPSPSQLSAFGTSSLIGQQSGASHLLELASSFVHFHSF